MSTGAKRDYQSVGLEGSSPGSRKRIRHPQYAAITASMILPRNNPEVYEAPKAAHASGSYKEIRDLDTLQKRGLFATQAWSSRELAVSPRASKTTTGRSWERPYIGDGARTLYETISFRNGTRFTLLYSRAIPLLQSSGTGKSRTLDELANPVFVIPINLRRKGNEGYPAADSALRDWLFLDFDKDVEAQRATAFLTALFVQTGLIVDQIDELLPNEQLCTLASKFRYFMTTGQQFDAQDPLRVQFYHGVIKLADQLLNETGPSTAFAKQSPKFAFMQKERNRKRIMGEITLVQAAAESIEKFREADGPQEQGDPFLVISLDEAHAVTEDPKTAVGGDSEWSKLSELRRAIRGVVSLPIFLIFVSAAGKIYQFSPTRQNDLSGRIQRGTLLTIGPFHEVGFDHLAEKVAGDGSWILDMVTGTKFIVRLSRPLFGSEFESGDEAVKDRIVEFDRKERVQVEKHMRICLTAGPGFEGAVTVAASEPILAEASAGLMNHKDFNVPRVLLGELQRPGLRKGDRGELIAMTILLLAHDKAGPRVTPLLPFVLTPFLDNLGNIVQAAMPSFINTEGIDKPLKETFLNSHIWFNHFIKVHRYDLLNHEYLWRLIVRGAAVLCATCQRGVDIVIPFLYNDKRLMKTNVSAIVIQVKNNTKVSDSPHRSPIPAWDPR